MYYIYKVFIELTSYGSTSKLNVQIVRISKYNITYPINESEVSNFWWCYNNL